MVSFFQTVLIGRPDLQNMNKPLKPGVPNLQDLMPDDLRWNWCSNNRNKVHSKCNALESSQNHPPPQCVEKLPSTKLVPGAKKVGDCCLNCLWYRLVGGHPPRRVLDVRTGWSSVSKYPGESETNGVLQLTCCILFQLLLGGARRYGASSMAYTQQLRSLWVWSQRPWDTPV